MILKYFNFSNFQQVNSSAVILFSIFFYWGFLFQNLWQHGQDVPQEDSLPAEASWRHRGPRSMCNNTASRLRGLVLSIALRGQITGCRLFIRQCGPHSAFSFSLIHTYTHTHANKHTMPKTLNSGFSKTLTTPINEAQSPRSGRWNDSFPVRFQTECRVFVFLFLLLWGFISLKWICQRTFVLRLFLQAEAEL